jgi:diphthine synthase
MVFYIIGLGLGDPEDISVKALNAIKSCKEVYLEYYTSVMSTSNKELETFLGVKLIEADRDFCEVEIDHLLERMSKEKEANYAFLVVGDAFCATTHSDLYLRSIALGIEVKVIHNASIISAVGCCGLQVYRFG